MRSRGPLVVIAAALTVPLLSGGCRESSETLAGRELLQRSAAALRAVGTVRYGFEFGGPDSAAGWITGTVTMRKHARLEDAWILVRGTVHAQAAFGIEQRSFAWATDGENAWARDREGAPVIGAGVGRGSNRLSATAVYAVVPEFVEPDPYWRELSAACTIEMRPRELIDGQLADQVKVTYQLPGGFAAETIWWIGAEDRLPRRTLWRAPFTGPAGMVLTLNSVEVGVGLSRQELGPPVTPRAEPFEVIGVGERLHSWTLQSSTGGSMRSEELAGTVVVLDFWNTWCPVCRGLAAATRELAAEFVGQPVQFLGVNILETGDPLEYWRTAGFEYPTLLHGEELGASLDLPWQPGVAVLDRRGVVVHQQLGASGDRTERLRSAIREALAADASRNPAS